MKRRHLLLTLLALGLPGFANAANGTVVLVTGATGQTGRLTVAALAGKGLVVRGMVRSAESAATLPPGVVATIADVTQPASLAAAVKGVNVVISTVGARFPIGGNGFAAVDWEGNRALIDAAKAAGVRHFILLSAGSAGRDGFPYSWTISPYPWKAKSEAHLRRSGMPYTIIAAGGLRDDPGGQKGVRLATRDRYQSAGISRADLAQVLAACVGEPAAVRKTITVVNDEAMSPHAWRRDFRRLRADHPPAK
jgi:uncharacterized protein YbjT (DUF2867 family)